jgi:hypothetical protein
MRNKKRLNNNDQAQQRDNKLNPFPGITGEGAEKRVARSTGGQTGGLFSDPGDGTIGEVGERYRERAVGENTDQQPDEYNMTSGTSISPISDLEPEATAGGMHSDIAGQLPHGPGGQVAGSPSGGIGADDVAGTGSGTGRGRGGSTPGGVAGGGDRSGTGAMGGGFDSQTGTGGVTGGLGNDIGGGMAPDLSPRTSGGMSGGTFGGSRESDVGGGLSGGMRSGTGADASGGMGDSDDETVEGDRQRSPRRREQHGR